MKAKLQPDFVNHSHFSRHSRILNVGTFCSRLRMTRSELEHAIRAACDVADETELWVLGSQAIPGQFSDAPAARLQLRY